MRERSIRRRLRRATAAACGAVMLGTAARAQEAAGDADGFVSLFDGRTLDGWVNVNCAPGTWSVRDGVIFCTGVPTGELRTGRQYENFVLELEWRHLVPRGNAGVFVWAAPVSAPGQPFLRAIEVQVLENAYGNTESYTTHGDIFPIHGSTMVPDPPSRGSRSFPTERRSRPAPEWNHYRIECNAGVIKLAVNGKVVSGGRECNYRKGYIALESEGGEVEYRNLRLKELPPSRADETNTAPLARGHRPLYSGVDLAGWKARGSEAGAGTEAGGWKPSDWILSFEPGAGDAAGGEGVASALATIEEFGDCEIICDWRWPDGAPDPARLTGVAGAILAVPPRTGEGLEAGRWHRVVATVRAGVVSLEVDGEAVPAGAGAGAGATPRGPLVLRPGGVRTQFAGIYVRELGGREG